MRSTATVLGLIAGCAGFAVIVEWRSVAFGNSRDYWRSGGRMLIPGGTFGFLIFVSGVVLAGMGGKPIPPGALAVLYVCALGGLCAASAYALCLRAVPRSTRRRVRYRMPPVQWDRTQWPKGGEIRLRYRRFGYVLTVASVSLLAAAIVLTTE